MADVKSKVSPLFLPRVGQLSSCLSSLQQFHPLSHVSKLIDICRTSTSYSVPATACWWSSLPDNVFTGNDSDQDSDREAPEPTKVAEKPMARSGKRDAPKEAPVEPQTDNAARGGRGGRRGSARGNEGGRRPIFTTFLA